MLNTKSSMNVSCSLLIDACKTVALFSSKLWYCGLGSFSLLKMFGPKSFNDKNQTQEMKVKKVIRQ